MFYYYAIMLSVCFLFMYIGFRDAIYNHLRLSKMSKKYIRKNRKGFRNYWFYSQIHQKHSLGILYYANLILLPLVLAFSILSILLGHLDALKIPIMILAVLLFLMEMPTVIWSSGVDSLMEYGEPFVLWRKRKQSNGYYSSLLYLLSLAIPAVITFLCIQDALGMSN